MPKRAGGSGVEIFLWQFTNVETQQTSGTSESKLLEKFGSWRSASVWRVTSAVRVCVQISPAWRDRFSLPRNCLCILSYPTPPSLYISHNCLSLSPSLTIHLSSSFSLYIIRVHILKQLCQSIVGMTCVIIQDYSITFCMSFCLWTLFS